MKKVFILCTLLFAAFAFNAHSAAGDKFISCGEGFLVVAKGKVDGIDSYECQKLWCRDLENGKSMGSGDKANSGYRATPTPDPGVEDSKGKQVPCFGDRKWCAGETPGVWNPTYGAYTKGGQDSNAYLAIQKGDCWVWQMQKPVCTGEGEVAVLEGAEWVCVIGEDNPNAIRASSIRRTGTIKRR